MPPTHIALGLVVLASASGAGGWGGSRRGRTRRPPRFVAADGGGCGRTSERGRGRMYAHMHAAGGGGRSEGGGKAGSLALMPLLMHHLCASHALFVMGRRCRCWFRIKGLGFRV